ncbi:dna polymerase v family and armadillo-type fold domain-containing [Pyrenophora seminiperda CCB06]|uniref:Dna polymerase v family and armadillo-type fold domain-containing n=1 Tax=Pyrenophora seminiperda CCB06 TaxID=1302712 RepID=A0A3M7M3S8_9PLEO|nr:dna polymerase v family and armadillo-type fold domain-containing [Pyrenophora seminiperda CCB06]
MDAGGLALSGTDHNVTKLKKPNKVIPVPLEFQRRTQIGEGDILVNEVKTDTGCELIPLWDKGKTRIYEFGIVGAGSGLEKAVRYINEWIFKARSKSTEASAWAKTPAFDPNKWYQNEIEEMERHRKQKFKGPLPHNASQLERKIVYWPEALLDHAITPRDIFKNKLESLDTIRTNNDVYITLLPVLDGVWQIEILGEQADKIATAQAQLQTVIEEVQADTTSPLLPINIVLDDREGLEVIIKEAELWWPNRHDRLVPRLISHPMMDIPGVFRHDIVHFTQLEMIQRAFQKALEAVSIRKGSYDLAIRLGCLALSSKKATEITPGSVFEKEAFMQGIEGIFQLDVKKWLAGHTMGSQILRELMSADHLLEPTKSAGHFGRMPGSLKATRPVLRGTWVFADPSLVGGRSSTSNAAQAPRVILQVDWTEDEEGFYEKGIPRYYRTDQGIPGPRVNMDINLLELGESRGWHFALESLISIFSTDVSPVLKDFASRLKMKAGYDFRSHEPFVVWDNTPTVKNCLGASRLETIYSFGIKKTSYKVECTGMWYPGQKDPAWGLCVRHFEWTTHLAELERIGMGHRASWGDIVETFIPDDGHSGHSAAEGHGKGNESDDGLGTEEPKLAPGPRDGIRILTNKLLQLSTMVSSIAGGATI